MFSWASEVPELCTALLPSFLSGPLSSFPDLKVTGAWRKPRLGWGFSGWANRATSHFWVWVLELELSVSQLLLMDFTTAAITGISAVRQKAVFKKIESVRRRKKS